jgi:hypothetical protein
MLGVQAKIESGQVTPSAEQTEKLSKRPVIEAEIVELEVSISS